MRQTPKEIFQSLLRHEPVDRIPWALWRHYPHEEYHADAFVQASVEYHREHNFDLIKIGPRSSYQIRDYGTGDYYDGDYLGRPFYPKPVISQASDWSELKPLDLDAGWIGQTLSCAQRIADQMRGERPILMTVFSPLTQARILRGPEGFQADLQSHPDELWAGLRVLKQNTQNLIDRLFPLNLDGIFYAIQDCGSPGLVASPLYSRVLDLDRALLERGDYWLNMLHLHGPIDSMDPYLEYPVSILHWDETTSGIPYDTVTEQYSGIVSGGIPWPQDRGAKSLAAIESASSQVMKRMAGKRFLLSATCVVPWNVNSADLVASRHGLRPSFE